MVKRVLGVITLLSVALTATWGCSRSEEIPESASGRESVGSAGLDITLDNGGTITGVHYRIEGNGITAIDGDIDVSDPAASVSFLVGGIPAGEDYVVTLTGTSTDGDTECLGSGTFDVIAGATTLVNVVLNCSVLDQTGSVMVDGRLVECPKVTSFTAAPLQVSVGGSINLSAAATTTPMGPTTFEWSSNAGEFADNSAPATTFECTTAGDFEIGVAVSNGICGNEKTLTVSCVPFCSVRPDGTPCDDASACTAIDECQAGVCVGLNPVSCTASSQCHLVGVCSPATGICSDPVAPDGSACNLINASASCESGACGIDSCLSGFGNCDLQEPTGCEESLQTSAQHCGSCNFACPAGASCVTGLCLSPPPTGVTATAGGFSVRLQWTASPGATAYEVLRSSASVGPFTSLGVVPATSFVDTSIATGTTYFYVVRSKSVGGTSADSSVANALPLTKQICVSSPTGNAVFAYGATQSGAAAPLRTLSGASTTLNNPQPIVANLFSGELFVGLGTAMVPVFSLAANGNVSPIQVLTGASPGGALSGLDLDPTFRELFTGDGAGARVRTLDFDTGALKRQISGAATLLTTIGGVSFDPDHGELFVGQASGITFRQIQVFGSSDSGNVASKRSLASANVGGWAIAYDRLHGEIVTSCMCDNRLTVFDRAASGAAAPLRTITLTGMLRITAILLDEGNDTLWVLGPTLTAPTRSSLFEITRGANGVTTALHAAVTNINTTNGRLAKCN